MAEILVWMKSLPWDRILSAIGGVLVTLFAAGRLIDFAPRIRVKISSRVVDKTTRKVAIKLEAENISKVLVVHHDERSLYQVLRFRMTEVERLTEFLPFNEKYLRDSNHMKNPAPITWRPAEPVMTTTTHWYPGDIVSVERIETIEVPDIILHVGLQVRGKTPALVRALLRLQRIGRPRSMPESWTTTAFVALPIESAQTSVSLGP